MKNIYLFSKIKIHKNFYYYFEAIPILQCLTLSANLREHKVWLKCSSFGDKFTNIKVLLFPPK